MQKGFKKLNRSFSFIMAVAVLACFPYQVKADSGQKTAVGSQSKTAVSADYESGDLNYFQYLAAYADADTPEQNIVLDAAANTRISGGEAEYFDNYENRAGRSVLLNENQSISWDFNVTAAGFYTFKLDYYTAAGTGGAIERRLLLDGKLPFDEAGALSFDRVWQNKDEPLKYDTQGNQIMISQEEVPMWRTQYAEDSAGYAGEPLRFYLSAGRHTLTVAGVHEPMILRSACFCSVRETQTDSYSTVADGYQKNGAQSVSKKDVITLQGEDATYKSAQMLTPKSDRTSPTVDPYDYARICYNAIGGDGWSNPGQWVEWKFYAPEDGKYALSAHFKQSYKDNGVSVREIRIDGEIPFTEAKNWMFPYDGAWQSAYFSDENGNPYEFYLTKGWHTINLRSALGKYNVILQEANDLLSQLNGTYREIIVITGASPDTFRDYRLDKMIPDTLSSMRTLSGELKAFEKELLAEDGRTANIPEIKKVYEFLDRMTKDSETVPKLLSSYKDSLAAFGNWINGRLSNPLMIDWLRLSPADMELPRGEANFFAQMAHYIKQFISSFFMDYSIIGKTEQDEEKSVTVWLTSGRDQAQLLRQCALSTFTPETKIAADVQLVSAGALLPAILANKGPDVVLGVTQDTPVNLALRNALLNLKGMDGFDEVSEWFYPESLVPFYFNDGIYALPETQTFSMLFYRKDILNQLDIPLSDLDSWDSLLGKVLPKLQKDSLSFGMAHTFANYLSLNYQHGGSLYSEDRRTSSLASSTAIDSMEMYTMLYTQYNLPVVYDFANRFRTGEVPVAVADYTQYNNLVMLAPEIKGLWGMLPIPGTLREDGTLDRSAAANVTGAVILANSSSQKEAWEFLKWWVSEDTQTQFGKGLESIIGAAARYNTANKNAMKNIQWDAEMRRSIIIQAENIRGIPEVPGGYITTRLFDFAFRDVVYGDGSVRESLKDAVFDIDRELANKRKEYAID